MNVQLTQMSASKLVITRIPPIIVPVILVTHSTLMAGHVMVRSI